MKTLQDIKNEYAYEFWGCIDWNDAINYEGYKITSDDVERISNMWAIEVAKQSLINASNNAEIEDYPDPNHGGYGQPEYYSRINKNSILTENNIPNSVYKELLKSLS